MLSQLFTLSAIATIALAKTDYEGCTSSTTVVFGGASVMYWDPTNGEICQYLDCGGGRAPPKTTVPGCGSYEGTETYSPSYLPGWGDMTSSATAPGTTATGYPTAQESSTEVYSTTVTPSSELYSTTIPASEVYSTTTPATTLITGAPVLPSASGTGSVYPTGNGTTVESPTLSTSSGPVEQTGGAGVAGAKQAVVGLMAGVFGLAML